MMLLFLALCPKSKHPIKIESQDTDTELKIQQFIFYTHNRIYSPHCKQALHVCCTTEKARKCIGFENT